MASKSSEAGSGHSSSSREWRIVLLGVTGAGKSTTGCTILGQEVFKESVTTQSEIKKGTVEGKNISVVDTPGFFGTALTDEQMRTEMEKSMVLTAPGPHLFLLVVRLGRISNQEKNIVKWIQENFGSEALKHTMVLFTGREKMTEKKMMDFLQTEEIQELISCYGGGWHFMNNTGETDCSQITKLLEKIEEMVEMNGGQHYSYEMYQETQRKIREEEGEGERKLNEQERKGKQEKDEKPGDVEIVRREQRRTKRKERKKRKARRLPFWGDIPDSVSDVRIVLIGRFESGKSSTGNIILGREAFDEVSGLNECRRQDGRVQGKTITVVDTPDIVPFSFTEQKAEMEKSLSMAHPGPHAFLLVIDKNQMMSYITRDFINELKENFGDEILKFTIFLFTHGVLWPDLVGRFLRMDGELQSLISSCGGRYHILNTEETEDQGQVTELLKKIEGMKEKNGGQYYTNDMYQRAQAKMIEKEEEIRKIRESVKRMTNEEMSSQNGEEENNEWRCNIL